MKSGLVLTNLASRQKPTLFFYPSLRASARWHLSDLHPSQREALLHLEARVGVIAQEYEALVASAQSDYSTTDPSRAGGEHTLHTGGQWDWHSYVVKGERQARFAAHCPETVELLESVPGLMTELPFGFAFFSTLHPQASIAEHSAPCNLRIRCHLPLRGTAHPGVGMRLAGEDVAWSEGKLFVFDDCYLHSVWNRSQEPRALLLFDIWHPDLSPDEQLAIVAMFREAERAKSVS